MEANFSGQNAAYLELLSERVDESAYDLRSWVKSLSIMGHWLDARSLILSMEDQLAYVCCAAEAGAASSCEQLPSLVGELLDQYGCEQARKK